MAPANWDPRLRQVRAYQGNNDEEKRMVQMSIRIKIDILFLYIIAGIL
jgi:hypothetical protein